MTQVAAVMGYKSRVLLKTIRAFTGGQSSPATRRPEVLHLHGVVGMPIIRSLTRPWI